MSFRLLGEQTAYEGTVVSIARAELMGPDGERYTREVVHHPGAVAVVPVEGGRTWLVRQFRSSVGTELLEVPAGKRDVAGEPAETTARRELEEEVGLVPGRLEHLGAFYTSPGFCDELVEVFLATRLKRSRAAPHGVEERHMEVVEISLGEAQGLLRQGKLADAKTIIGLALAREELHRRGGRVD